MPNLADLISVTIAFSIVTVSPGPANIAVATVSMRSGRRPGLMFGVGLSFGLAFWGVIAATGLGALLQGSAHLLSAMKLLGGVYLLWLAYQSGRSALKATVMSSDAPRGRPFRQGLVLNLSNPKAVLAWMAALAMGLGTGDDGTQVIAVTSICVALGFLNYAGYAMIFSLSGAMAGYARLRRWIDGLVSGLFAVAGLGLIKSGLSR